MRTNLFVYFATVFVVALVGLVTAAFLAALLFNGTAIALGIRMFDVVLGALAALAFVVAVFATIDFATRRKQA
jgi:uncharacterized membrane protein YccC